MLGRAGGGGRRHREAHLASCQISAFDGDTVGAGIGVGAGVGVGGIVGLVDGVVASTLVFAIVCVEGLVPRTYGVGNIGEGVV